MLSEGEYRLADQRYYLEKRLVGQMAEKLLATQALRVAATVSEK
jgi:hypothetical protein